MDPRPKKQREVDVATPRQLGLGLSFEARPDPRPAPPASGAGSFAPGSVSEAIVPLAAPLGAPSLAPDCASPAAPLGVPSLASPLAPLGTPSFTSLVEPLLVESVPVPDAPRGPRVFGVAELVRAARLTLEGRFAEVRVEGEVSGFKRSGPGHLYFSVKDNQAALDCVMYAREAARLRFQIEDGMAVRLRGRLTIYEGRGRFQMSVAEIEPTGAGALAIAFEQLKQKLEAAGLFDTARKRPLPFLPRRLGVVTSPQGSVIQDIIRVAHRRFPIPILLAPTPVQGPGAAAGIVAALERLGRVSDVDVIIVARGGGSIEDLWSFNEEAVARAIAASPVPVISAVGHETDFTIADFVADLRAPTPSAAAELAVPVLLDLLAEFGVLRQRAARGTAAQLRQARLMLERARTRLGDPRRLCNQRRQLLDDLGGRAHRLIAARLARRRAELAAVEVALTRVHPHRRIATQKAHFATLGRALDTVTRRDLQRRRSDFDLIKHKLEALSPRRVLDRGYSLAFGSDGHLLTDASTVTPGDRIRVALRRGEVAATVIDSDKKVQESVRKVHGK